LSPQAKEALAKRYKIGKYRDWVFSPERLAEITLKFELRKKGKKYDRKKGKAEKKDDEELDF